MAEFEQNQAVETAGTLEEQQIPEEPSDVSEPSEDTEKAEKIRRKEFRNALTAFLFTLTAAVLVAIGSGTMLSVDAFGNRSEPDRPASSVPDFGNPGNRPGDGSNTKPDSEKRPVNPDAPKIELNGIEPGMSVLSDKEIVTGIQPSVVTVVSYEVNGEEPRATGEGSGVVISADGYILTNSHVVNNSVKTPIVIVDSEGNAYEAYVVGCDAKTDLAVVKTESDSVGLKPAVFGDSETLSAGDSVFAVGNPGGLEYAGTVTKGIVSATERVVGGDTNSLALIQTDAAINPGNSGGALVNEYGQVIGITSAKIVSTSFEGMGFAIPITPAKRIVDDLAVYGEVRGRVRLGISYLPVSAVTAAFYDWPQGIQILGMDKDGVFRGTKVQENDIIVEIGGEAVRDAGKLYEVLDPYRPGDRVEMKLYRPDTQESFTVEVELLEE